VKKGKEEGTKRGPGCNGGREDARDIKCRARGRVIEKREGSEGSVGVR